MAFRNNANNNSGYQNRGIICRFYLRGCCAFGNYCRYIHINPNDGATFLLTNNIGTGTENFTRNSYQIGSSSNNDNFHNSSEPRDYHLKDIAGDVNIKTSDIDNESSNDSSLSGATCSNWEHVDESGKFISTPKTSSTDSTHAKECSRFNIDQGFKNNIKGENNQNIETSFDLLKNRESTKYSSYTKQQYDSELSLAIKRSRDKACGICMDIIVEKNPINLRTFGILLDCNHVFCLSCIRTWRQEHQFENNITKACPECRVHSDFVIPSKYWIDKEAKLKFIEEYKKHLSSKPCKFFRQGKGYCTYDDKCFYLHAYPDGRIAERQSKQPRPKRLACKDAEQFIGAFQAFLLAELMEECNMCDYLELSFHSDIFDDSFDESLLELMLG